MDLQVRRIMEWCIENGMTSLKAMVHEENRDSIGFIERMGFRRDGRMGRFILYGRKFSVWESIEPVE